MNKFNLDDVVYYINHSKEIRKEAIKLIRKCSDRTTYDTRCDCGLSEDRLYRSFEETKSAFLKILIKKFTIAVEEISTLKEK